MSTKHMPADSETTMSNNTNSINSTDKEKAQDLTSQFSSTHKAAIVALLSFIGFLATFSSTAILPAVPNIADDLKTTQVAVNIGNAVYVALLGFPTIFWGQMARHCGRRPPVLIALVIYTLANLATSFSPEIASFTVFRILAALEATCFLVVGASICGDLYVVTERATAIGYFIFGIFVGTGVGPLITGAIITTSTWRWIFWSQTACLFIVTVLTYFYLPETVGVRESRFRDFSALERAKKIASWLSPVSTIKLYKYPGILFTSIASGALLWGMYSILTPIRQVLNPRFGLTTPLQSGLLYLAPGAGYLIGCPLAGKWSDYMVKRWKKKTSGVARPEDRLRATLVPFLLNAASTLIYGWSVEKKKGGMAVPIIFLFLSAFAQMACFSPISAYSVDVIPGRGSEVLAANYLLRYSAGAAGTAAVLPVIGIIGIGWFSTLSAGLIFVSTALMVVAIYCPKKWHP
ncbi:Itaconate transport protein [Lachnellula occidentalis]|uniref:Itaconate transport protein n=1 Tax=Lachnellula occidentalis TaxID=215460 RepID=A0A8H8RTB0_9HELO|nr:Itaconate transport protein [Lachnellula occidentalis]